MSKEKYANAQHNNVVEIELSRRRIPERSALRTIIRLNVFDYQKATQRRRQSVVEFSYPCVKLSVQKAIVA